MFNEKLLLLVDDSEADAELLAIQPLRMERTGSHRHRTILLVEVEDDKMREVLTKEQAIRRNAS